MYSNDKNMPDFHFEDQKYAWFVSLYFENYPSCRIYMKTCLICGVNQAFTLIYKPFPGICLICGEFNKKTAWFTWSLPDLHEICLICRKVRNPDLHAQKLPDLHEICLIYTKNAWFTGKFEILIYVLKIRKCLIYTCKSGSSRS